MSGAVQLSPELKEAFGAADFKFIGHVLEGKDKAHVVYRMTFTVAGTKIDQVALVSLQRAESGWGMLLLGDIEAMTNSLKQQFRDKKD